MLRYGGDMVVEWMVWMCNLTCEQGEAPDQTIIIPLYKGKGSVGMNVILAYSVSGKVYGSILTERE